MGTHSTVKFYSEYNQEEPILSVYQQFDGYIDGVGYDLAKFLKGKKVINGIKNGDTMKNGFANGMGCLAAQYVADKKKHIGGFYLTTIDKEDEEDEEYNYKVRLIDNAIQIEVDDLFKGTPEQLLNFKEHNVL